MAIQCLAYRIVYEQQKGCVLCPSSLVSTVLLQQHSIHKGLYEMLADVVLYIICL